MKKMKETNRFLNKQVLVIGLAMSGFHAALLLNKLGAHVTVNDAKDLQEDDNARQLKAVGIKVIGGEHPLNLVNDSLDYVVKNPGIPYSQEQIQQALEINIPILTEVEIAYSVMESNLIALTGTNGKTTTTSMLVDILNMNRSVGKAYAAGNIGIPASQVAQESTSQDDVVMELSSFQLMGIKDYRPHIAVITNIYSAHLDYHGSQKEYEKAKFRIMMNQTNEDYLVYNHDQKVLRGGAKESKAQLVPFSRETVLLEGAFVRDNWIWFKEEKIFPLEELLVKGTHNVENALAAVATAKLAGQSNENIQKSLKKFTGVAHRLQYVDQLNSRKFYNDSKATNTLATIQALSSFEQKVVLIAGGLDRHVTFEELIPSFSEKVRVLIVFGESKEQIAEVGKAAGVSIIKHVESMEEAVNQAYQMSRPEETILLSPACASWDEYANFEERGNAFIVAVEKLMDLSGEETAN